MDVVMSFSKKTDPIRVLIIDDSILIRKILSDILNQDPRVTVIGTADNGRDGLEKILALQPQVVIMDVQMPVMDGLQALEQIMIKRPTPVIILSSVTTEGAHETLQAFDLGAFDVSVKPKNVLQNPKDFSNDITNKVKAAAKANLYVLRHKFSRSASSKETKAIPKNENLLPRIPVSIVVIGVSTGGPPALQAVLPYLPADFPVPIIIVQHMPPGFTAPLAQRLDAKCQMSVREAQNGEVLLPGNIYVAPAGYQTKVTHRLSKISLQITKQVEGNPRYWPSVDVTLASLAEAKIRGVMSVIMTGMGNDGLEGVKLIKNLQGFGIAQSEETCIVYGMPRAIVEAGLADRIIPIDDMAKVIIECVKRRHS